MEIEQWQDRVIVYQMKVNNRNIIIAVLILIILGLVYTLVHSMRGWSETKSECAGSRKEIEEIRKKLFEQKSEQVIKCPQENLLRLLSRT